MTLAIIEVLDNYYVLVHDGPPIKVVHGRTCHLNFSDLIAMEGNSNGCGLFPLKNVCKFLFEFGLMVTYITPLLRFFELAD